MDNNPTAPASETPDAANSQPTVPTMNMAPEAPVNTNPSATAGIPTQPTTQPMPAVANATPAVANHSGHSSWLLYVVIAIALLILVGGGAWVLLTRTANPQANQSAQVIPTTAPISPTVMPSPTPVISPITPQNADQSLNNTETNIDQSLQQATTDMNSMDQINSSQDNPNSVN